MQLQENQLFASHYRLERLLGRGGFSEVWLAHDETADVRVAVKVYAPGTGLDDDGADLFRKEFKIVFDMNHTNLLRPNYFDVVDNMPYLVMPYVERGSTTKMTGGMPEAEVWKFVRDVASGLAYLHAKEPPVIHQDIKPDNVMVMDDGTYVITDFGISTRARSSLRKSVNTNASPGTMAYMGPERFSKENAPIKASDVWSLGATVYELMEGDVPFGRFGGTMQKSGAEVPNIHGAYSEELKELVYDSLSQETWDRPTAEQLSDYASDRIRGCKPDKPWKRGGGGQQGGGRETQLHPRPNPPVPPTPQPKPKKNLAWLWVILSLIVVGGIVIYIIDSKKEDGIQTFIVGGVSFNMVKIDGGEFKMGNDAYDKDADEDEYPAVSKHLGDFFIGETEVTQKLWKAVMGKNPSTDIGDNKPVNNVNWEDCQIFIQKLNQKTGRNFRLPYESEWEYAAKHNPKTQKSEKYSGGNYVDDCAWYKGNSENKIHTVMGKNKNAHGLYDMSGNVIEWCQDVYLDYSDVTPILNSNERVLRGGYYGSDAVGVRSTCRGSCNAEERSSKLACFGLRLCL